MLGVLHGEPTETLSGAQDLRFSHLEGEIRRPYVHKSRKLN